MRVAASLIWLKLMSSSTDEVNFGTLLVQCSGGCVLVQNVTEAKKGTWWKCGVNGWMWIQLWITKVQAYCQKEVNIEETAVVPPPERLPLETTWEWFQRSGLNSLGGYAVLALPDPISKTLCALRWVLWDKWS